MGVGSSAADACEESTPIAIDKIAVEVQRARAMTAAIPIGVFFMTIPL
jgi:hypothetical protein